MDLHRFSTTHHYYSMWLNWLTIAIGKHHYRWEYNTRLTAIHLLMEWYNNNDKNDDNDYNNNKDDNNNNKGNDGDNNDDGNNNNSNNNNNNNNNKIYINMEI